MTAHSLKVDGSTFHSDSTDWESRSTWSKLFVECLVFHWLIWWPDRGNSWMMWDCLTRSDRHTTGYRPH